MTTYFDHAAIIATGLRAIPGREDTASIPTLAEVQRQRNHYGGVRSYRIAPNTWRMYYDPTEPMVKPGALMGGEGAKG